MVDGQEHFSGYCRLMIRNPGWVSVGLGAVGGGVIGGVSVGAIAMVAGLAMSPTFIGGVAGFFIVMLLVSYGLTVGSTLSMPNLMSAVLSLGHTAMLGAFGWALLMPEMAAPVLATVAHLPFLSAIRETGNPLLTAGPIFLIALVAYSVLAPVSLMIFRYISFRK